MTDFYEDRMKVFFDTFQKFMTVSQERVDGFLYKKCGYKSDNTLPEIDDSFVEYDKIGRWGGKQDEHAWFYKKLIIPEQYRGKNVELVISTDAYNQSWNAINPQFIVYLNGALVQGLDMNHREIFLDNAEESYELYIYAYTGMNGDGWLDLDAKLVVYNEEARKLYYSLKVPFEVTEYLNPDEKTYIDIEKHILNTVNLLDMRVVGSAEFNNSVKAAQKYIDEEFFKKCRIYRSSIRLYGSSERIKMRRRFFT